MASSGEGEAMLFQRGAKKGVRCDQCVLQRFIPPFPEASCLTLLNMSLPFLQEKKNPGKDHPCRTFYSVDQTWLVAVGPEG